MLNTISVYSYVDINIDISVRKYQKKVFDKFNIPLIQIIKDTNKHGEVLQDLILNCDNDYIVFFDIDCIPLSPNVINILYKQIKDGNTLAGAIGCANHLDPNFLYVHPCFMGFKKQLYYDCGAPSMYERNFDIGGWFTWECRSRNKNVKFWDITHCDNKIWDITPLNKQFGHGTTYENLVYHQFEIRKFSDSFINKCKEVL